MVGSIVSLFHEFFKEGALGGSQCVPSVVLTVILLALGGMTTPGVSGSGPVDGYDNHVQTPSLMPDGSRVGSFHHYGKGISN